MFETQLSLFPLQTAETKIDIHNYDYYIVAFSGGKDSIASFLHLLDCGVPKEKIELWHHRIDGHEGSTLMDWPVTDSYCKAFAKAFDVPIYYSWRIDGFEGEMLRNNSRTNATKFEYPDDNIIECGLAGGNGGKIDTRMKFPQVSADLQTRWCSSYLKIDVCTLAITNQKRFRDKRTLVITGERAQESSARAKYKVFEPDRSDRRNGVRVKRHVDHWRPVHKWNEAEVWSIFEKYKVNPHPAYRLGWGRLSCMFCIFGSDNQWATAYEIDHERVDKIIQYEKQFNTSIHRNKFLPERIGNGSVYKAAMNKQHLKSGLSKEFTEPIIVDDWTLPAGAFGESNGPN